MAAKDIEKIFRNQQPHWVGDGFPVRSLFSHFTAGSAISPFLLLDYAGPHEFAPAPRPLGVELHPHRGFETVTIVYQGELEHRNSAGNRGTIGPGDVQWMAAASGVLHEEHHSERFARDGGTLEMVQLWVNLPAKTFTPVNLWDLRLKAGHTTVFEIPEGFMAALVVQRGTVRLDDQERLQAVDLALFSRTGDRITIAAEAEAEAMALLLAGEAIDEPVVAQGPFVMNTKEEIQEAIRDY